MLFFLDFTGIGSLKYKEIRVSGTKHFYEHIFSKEAVRTEYTLYLVMFLKFYF